MFQHQACWKTQHESTKNIGETNKLVLNVWNNIFPVFYGFFYTTIT